MDQNHTKNLALELANRSTFQVVAETLSLVFIAVVALAGNSCVLYVFLKSPRFRSVTNYYLIVLAISDVMYSLIIMPVVILASGFGKDILGAKLGTVSAITGYSFVSGSLQTTTLIAVNRFFCVVKPDIYRRYFRPKPTILMVCGMWLFSVFNGAGVYLSGIADFKFYPGRFAWLLSFKDFTAEVTYAFLSLLLFEVVPLSIAGISYWKIYKVVKRHKSNVLSRLNNSVGPSTAITISPEDIRITRSVLALVFGFVVCWLPCGIVNTASTFCNLSRYVEMIFIYTASLSTAINPIVFNMFNKPFRKQFIRVFCGKRMAGASVDASKAMDQGMTLSRLRTSHR